ncbi:hypothetical protein HJP15_01400 [Pseudoalteromonas sp. NEC-BIFX-2020_002]|uniref:hypothetical protein n=1 Tax=Pseudoalteromonas sp. NEC-BIFX-2020_002 TaxID=2732353 RepID=UPI001477843B|nr:hypothetical protein [Pseudoalteromonas sp. NEC-BIFX-2020_002]NNG41607.1 hypothetical protein [Pseudoalteromonas sp. NEC-BIFX-2020_002]
MKTATLILSSLIIAGCNLTTNTPATLAETQTSYSYIPFDPLPVQTLLGASCSPSEEEKLFKSIRQPVLRDLRHAFPDQTVRLAVAEFTANGGLSFGPSTVGFEGKSYQVIIDYANTDTVKGSFLVKREISGQIPEIKWWGGKYTLPKYETYKQVKLFEDIPMRVISKYSVEPNPTVSLFNKPPIQFVENKSSELNQKVVKQRIDQAEKLLMKGYEVVNLPVYVGVGLRLTATINVLNGKVNLSGLPAIAAEAQSGNLTGTLVVQTLGATGELVSANLPLPSELNRTTVQNSILSLGSIKALLYDDKMHITPRVIGIYNPIGGGQSFVNGIISALASERLTWYRPCDYIYDDKS